MQDSVDLFSVKLRKLLLWHIVDEEIIPNLGVSVNALAVSLSDSLREYSRVLRVEQEVDSSQLAIFFSAIPVACEKLTGGVICVD